MTEAHAASQEAADEEGGLLAAEASRLFAVAVAILRDRADAEDVVQETLTIAWGRRGDLRETAARPRWLTQICVRQALSLRRRLRRATLVRLHTALPAAPDAVHDADMDRVYATLPVRQRTVLALHYHHGYTLDECASLMGCRPGTARAHLARALARLRKELDDDS